MTVPLIELETQDFVAAARLLRLWAGEPAELAVRGLWSALEGSAGMAGNDPGGTEWAAAYDRAAGAALNAAADGLNGVNRLSAMLAQTARNYEAADHASTPAVRRLLASSVATLPCVPAFVLPSCAAPSARGTGSGGGPPGWGLVCDLVGYVWPNGHQGRLRAAAAAWRRSAHALAAAADETVAASQRAVADRLPEGHDVWTVCSGLADQLRRVSSVHAALGDACDELAHHLDRVHSEVIGELRSLIEWTAGIEAAGGLLSVVSFGLAEVPAQAAEATRIAKTAATVGALIERFIGIARGLASSVAALVERAEAAGARLRAVAGARLTAAGVTVVGRYRLIKSIGTDVGAIRLGRTAMPTVREYTDKAAARAALPGELRPVSNRFFRDATAKCRDYRVTALSDGGYRMEFYAPARNPGYGKLYVQEVDARGAIMAEYKDTIGPSGVIERKWNHGEPK